MEQQPSAALPPSSKYFETILPPWAATPEEAIDRLKGTVILCLGQYFYAMASIAHGVKAVASYKSKEQESGSHHVQQFAKNVALAWAFSFYYPDLLDLSVVSNGTLIFTACVVATIWKPTSFYMALDFIEKKMNPNNNPLSHDEIRVLSVGGLLDSLVDGRVNLSNVFNVSSGEKKKKAE